MSLTRVESAEPLYRDPSRQRDERVEDLLRRMTREEKAAQLGSAWVFQLADGGELSTARATELLRHGLGHVTRISGASSLDAEASARLANAIQKHLVEETRLGIPAIVHEEICSGLMAREATVFPQAIGLASTWDPDLAEELADAIRVQMRAVGAHQGLAPVLDVCRDPRWGRTEETFGEDPYLVSRIGVAFVRGLQGASLRDGVIATLKHFVGYGASDGGMNWAPAGIPPRELREVYLHPFEAAVRTAGAASVMNAYNEIDGVLVRGRSRSAHHDPAGRVGIRRVRRLRLLLHSPARGLPSARTRRRERCRPGARRRARRRAAGHRLLRSTAPAGARVRARRRRRAERGGPPSAASEVRRRRLRRALRRRRARLRRRGHSGPPRARATDRPQERRPLEERRRPPARLGARVDRRDRPECRRRTQPLRRLRIPRTRRVAAHGARQRTQQPVDPRRRVGADRHRTDRRAVGASRRCATDSARRSPSPAAAT